MAKLYHIITIGCQMNKSDSERFAQYLENLGYKEERDRYLADLVVLTTCGVRQSAEDSIYGIIPRLKKKKPGTTIILTGCLSRRADIKKKLAGKVDIWLPIKDLANLKYILERSVPEGKQDYLKLPAKHSSSFAAFVPIGNGCNNYCSYCVVPDARGRETYRSVRDILGEVKELAKKGYKEINLIAQNVNSYRSGKTGFAELLCKINNIHGDFWIRFSTSHPKDMSDELIKAIADCDKVCEHVHLPAQAGNNEILQAMNRKYTVEHYKTLINKIRRALDKSAKGSGWRAPVALTTDIIVGFPGETKEQFAGAKKLFAEMKFDMAYIAQYSKRPGTAAAKMADDVSDEEKERRENELEKILRKTALENNKAYAGNAVPVMVFGKNKKGELIARTRTSKNVKIKNAGTKLYGPGTVIYARITKAESFGLEGELVN